jgi:tetratricopeptide (TPR) repeat protein
LWDLLEADYDVEPTQQTQDLIVEAKAALPFSGAAGATTVAPLQPQPNLNVSGPVFSDAPSGRNSQGKLVLSVGPFKLSRGESERNYLVQGFRQELIGCLVRFREWLVRDAGQDFSPGNRQTANDEFLLDASGYESSDALHFVLTLRNATTGTYLWSENLTLTLERWHHLQKALVRRVAAALNVHVSAERMHQITIPQDVDLKAHDIWLFGQATLLSMDREKWDKAAALFRRVVQQTPDYAPAFSSLAQLNNSYHIVKPGLRRDPQRTQEALAFAREAVRLDPLDSRSQLCLGWSHAMAKQYEQAMIYIPLAHDLNDNDPWTLVSAANCYAFCGRPAPAVEIIDATLRNMPFAPTPLQWAYHTAIRFMSWDYESCLAAADFAGDLNPNVRGFKAAALYHLGQHALARAELNNFFTVVRNRWCAKEPATPEAMTRWFLHLFPIALPEDWQRLRKGIAGAGAPVEGLSHHQW